MIKVSGILLKGYGIASGRADDSPYPAGSIELQAPHFLKQGLDIRHCFQGTLNISIAPCTFSMIKPEWTFKRVKWYNGYYETFSFSRCEVRCGNNEVEGFVYYPHPETKPDHFHDDSVIEVLAPYLEEIEEGRHLTVFVREEEIEIYS